MKKLIYITILAVISYAGIYSWALLRVPRLVSECTASPKDKAALENPQKLSSIEQAEFTSKTWTCVKEKQSLIEYIVTDLPK